jgi:hypothetical protein
MFWMRASLKEAGLCEMQVVRLLPFSHAAQTILHVPFAAIKQQTL